jgi:predicted ABC-class ATPase
LIGRRPGKEFSMRDKQEFFSMLAALDGKPLGEYGRLVGDFDFSRFVLKINQAQAGLLHQPILLVIRVPQAIAGFPTGLFQTPVRRTALEDFLNRKIAAEVNAQARYDRSGVSRRRLHVVQPGQKILPRSAVVVSEEFIEARIGVDLPSEQGLIIGARAREIFIEDLPALVNRTLIYCNLEEAEVRRFIEVMEDADQIRQLLPTRGLVSFVAPSNRLCRREGTDLPDEQHPRPLTFSESLLIEIEAPNRGVVRGLGIPSGITLILGDAYSGRRELLRALADGVYNHVPGDGRELVLTVPDAVYIAADPDRSVQKVDLRAFVAADQNGAAGLPYTAVHVDRFCAQAASTVEALEVGARVLLLDESDSAPGFLGRDRRLDALLQAGAMSTTPLSARARQMVDELGVSLVVAGSATVAEFIPVADLVLRISDFTVEDVTESAKRLVSGKPAETADADLLGLHERSRWIVPSSIDPSAGLEDVHVRAEDRTRLEFGRTDIDLSAVHQLADAHQTETIGLIIHYARRRYIDEPRPLREVLDLIDRDLSTEGLECLSRDLRGDLSRPRRYEIAAALNRLGTLRIGSSPE